MNFLEVALLLIALVLSCAALGLALNAHRTAARPDQPTGPADLPEDARGLRQEVAALKAEQTQALRNVAVVRYDAFEDTGGHLSWTVALLDDTGSGVLLTSIHGRNDARTYAKPVHAWSSDSHLSPEETDALAHARGRGDGFTG